mmetsp:Transcript_123249/g.356057  ORF Transcript_123249/g.356057 Transcript_123249/m.356057 type:complete len:520 (-) Transcript_123249:113-1672(-)
MARCLVIIAPLTYGVLGFPCISGHVQIVFRVACGGNAVALLLWDSGLLGAWAPRVLYAASLFNLVAMVLMSHWWCLGFLSWILLASAGMTFQASVAMRLRGFLHLALGSLALLVSFVSRVGASVDCVSQPELLESATQTWLRASGALAAVAACELLFSTFKSSSVLMRRLSTLRALLTAPLSEFEARAALLDYSDEELNVKAIVPIFDGVSMSKRIGRGSFGHVFLGTWNGQPIAVKVITRLQKNENREALLREPRIAMVLKHPRIVATHQCGMRLADGGKVILENSERESVEDAAAAVGNGDIKACSTDDIVEIWMLQELCDRGTFHDFCSTPRWASDTLPEACDMLLDVAQAGKYLHAHRLVHADLTGNNILLKSDASSAKGFVCKVMDFGMTRVLDAGTGTTTVSAIGTVTHAPPEHFKVGGSTVLTTSTDVYALGVLLWQAIMGEQPFLGVHPSNVVIFISEGKRLELQCDVPGPLRELYCKCVSSVPEERPSFQQVASLLEEFVRHPQVCADPG